MTVIISQTITFCCPVLPPNVPLPCHTLKHTHTKQLAATVLTVAQHALAHIDLSSHQAQHPRLGVVDHVSLHPLGPDASLSLAAQAATAIGQQLSQPPLQLPVYYYGAAHATGCRRLAEIRRNLGVCVLLGLCECVWCLKG